MLVALAGLALQRTSYSFALSPGGKYTAAVAALERSLMEQRTPQRTIAAAFGGASGSNSAVNDEVISSVGQLWREGWRCKREQAQHCVRFFREAPRGAGPSGEIMGLRSFADFAHVLAEWHEELHKPEFLGPRNDHARSVASPRRPAHQRERSRSPPLVLGSSAAGGESHVEFDLRSERPAEVQPPVKVSRFFAKPSVRGPTTTHDAVSGTGFKASAINSVSNTVDVIAIDPITKGGC